MLLTSQILDESDLSGNFTNEYIFFAGKRIAMRNVSTGTIYYYEEDMLGSSRTIVQSGATSPCYDADFLPFGYEKQVTNTCSQSYKFEGKERDTETSNDDFGARYYSNRFGRWLSADWSSVPAAVPYANLTNPQTLNLYAMVSDNPESFADLTGHDPITGPNGSCGPNKSCGIISDQMCADAPGACEALKAGDFLRNLTFEDTNGQSDPAKGQQKADENAKQPELVVKPTLGGETPMASGYNTENVIYTVVKMDSKGQTSNLTPDDGDHQVALKEEFAEDSKNKSAYICQPCVSSKPNQITDTMTATAGKPNSVVKRFTIDGRAARVYDPKSNKAYNYVRVDAQFSAKPSKRSSFTFTYGNDPKQ